MWMSLQFQGYGPTKLTASSDAKMQMTVFLNEQDIKPDHLKMCQLEPAEATGSDDHEKTFSAIVHFIFFHQQQ